MSDLYEKLCLIVGELLCYSHKVIWASAPIFGEGCIILKFRDSMNNELEIDVPHMEIVKLHDHSLQAYIFELASKKGLL